MIASIPSAPPISVCCLKDVAAAQGKRWILHGLQLEVPADVGKRLDDQRRDPCHHHCFDQLDHAFSSFPGFLAAKRESSSSRVVWSLWMISTSLRTAGSTAPSIVGVSPMPSETSSGSQPTTSARLTLPPRALSSPKMASGSRPGVSPRADWPSEAAC